MEFNLLTLNLSNVILISDNFNIKLFIDFALVLIVNLDNTVVQNVLFIVILHNWHLLNL